MQLFYHPALIASDRPATVMLDSEESFHCAKVLRLQTGETVHITNGKGLLASGTLISNNPRNCVAELHETRMVPDIQTGHIHIAIAPTKNIDRFEWFLEKATETGVSEITPIWCEHSERKNIKPERLEKILIAAMKQCQRVYLPVLNKALTIKDFISTNMPADTLRFLAHAEVQHPIHLAKAYKPGSNCIVLIGPEGDFSPAEVNAALTANYQIVSLGRSRLRTETAALYACMAINALNEKATNS